MNNKWILILLGIALVLIQYISYPFLNIDHFIPDLVLIYLLLLSVKHESGFVLIMAFLLGIFQDLFLTNFIGISSVGNLLAVYPIVVFSKSRVLETSSFLWKIAIVTSIKSLVVFYFILLKEDFGITHIFVYYSLPTIFYTLITSFILLALFKNILDKYVSA